MSRYTVFNNEGLEISWGIDHACGYFIQVFDNNADNEEDFMLLDLDSVFNDIGEGEVIDIASQYNVDPVYVANTLARGV